MKRGGERMRDKAITEEVRGEGSERGMAADIRIGKKGDETMGRNKLGTRGH